MLNQKYKIIGALVATLTLLGGLVVANNPYTYEAFDLDTSHFPLVHLEAQIKDSGNAANHLRGKDIMLYENSEPLKTPKIILPPRAYSSRIDLYVLIDRGAATKNYIPHIRANLKQLVQYMVRDGVDLEVHIATVSPGDQADAVNVESYKNSLESTFDGEMDNFEFESGERKRSHGLSKLYYLVTRPGRSGAQRVALVLSGSPFYDKNRGDQINYDFRELINKLTTEQFITFFVGSPLRQFAALHNEKTENEGLIGSLSGGYLGSFSADLTRLYDLLKQQKTDRFIIEYFSQYNLNQASGGSAEMYIDDIPMASIDYGAISSDAPVLSHNPPSEILSGEDYKIEVEVDMNGKFIDAIELKYLDKNGVDTQVLMRHDRLKQSAGKSYYFAVVPNQKLPTDNLVYEMRIHSPFYTSSFDQHQYVIPVLEYDPGIELHALNVNHTDILWSWSGETVDLGTKFQLWGGDYMITETTAREFMIPVEECKKYQVVKLKVKLPSTAGHQKAGGWSLFSRPGEYYIGPEGNITESDTIDLMMRCLDNKVVTNKSAYTNGLINYSPSESIALGRSLYYLTGLMNSNLQGDIKFNRYPIVYLLMQYINRDEFVDYLSTTVKVPQSLIYKLITSANQDANFVASFNEGMQYLLRRILGNTSF